jgi:hypothetical protein
VGYERPKKVFVLQFGEDSPYQGLEVRARSGSVGALMDMMGLSRLQDIKRLDPESIRDITGLFRMFASKLETWNLEEDGQPIDFVPQQVDGQRETPAEARYRVLMDQDMDFVMDLVFAWIDGMVGTPGPLEKTSKGGGQSEEALIPMEALSGALPN